MTKKKADKRIFLSAPDMGGEELTLIEEAFASNYIAPAGPMIERFEKSLIDFTGIPYAVALSSGTAALHLALRLAGVGRGDDVWCSTLTFIGNVAPVLYQDARPVFFDVDAATWNMDVGLLEERLKQAADNNALPAALLPTDVFGQACDMDAILEVAGRWEIPVVFDSAEALGATYRGRHAGDGGFASVFSFNGNKIITSSGGGALATHNEDVAQQARFLSQQARDPAPHYQHSTIGYNYRMSNVVAAIGLGQMGVLRERVARRRAIFDLYKAGLADLPGISFMPEADYGQATRWLTVMLLDPKEMTVSSDALRVALEERNVECRPVWKPMHLQPLFADATMWGGRVAEDLFTHGLCLPSGSGLSDSEISFVCNCIRDVVAS